MDQPSGVPQHHHAVQFYGNDESLFTTVAGFLSEGLIAGQPSVVIATPFHAEEILERLTGRLIDVPAALRSGDLVVLDASEQLAMFMVADAPDQEKFEAQIGAVFARLLANRSQTIVRAYGEMVDILWKEGKSEAAIRLEIFWNQLATRYGFALLCGYSMGNFYKQAEQFQEVCRQHSHVLETDSNVVVFDKRAKTA